MIPTARTLLALLPLAALALTAIALRPRGADVRLALVRACATVAAVTIVCTELLSLLNSLAFWPVLLCWLLGTAVAGVFAARRWPRRLAVQVTPGSQRLVLAATGLLVLAELVLALASSPNNFDSNHYHLPKIEHWIADGNLGVYPTVQTQQIILVPGAEMLLLQVRLLTGDDSLYNLLQWAAALLGAVAVARCARQLGAGPLGQSIAAAVFLSTPAVVLESTSTQNDLVVTAWVVCATTIALDGVRRIATTTEVLTLSGLAGLTAVTKFTGLMPIAALLLCWGVCQLRQRKFGRTAAATAMIVVGLVVLAGPSMLRVQQAFGSPLGPPDYSASLSTERHDPPAVLVNGLRLVASALLTPVPAVNEAVSGAVLGVARVVGVDPNDPEITQWRSTFPGNRWKPDEDRSPYPVQAAVVLLAAAATLACWRRLPVEAKVAGLTVLAAFALTASVIKWQDWGNRLILPSFAAGVPLAGMWADRLRTSRTGAAVMVLVLAAGFTHGGLAVALGEPRRLAGDHSVFTLDDWQERFVRQPDAANAYREAIDAVRAGGARRVGLVMDGDLWEYPFQITLTDVELVELESEVPTAPPAPVSSVQAIICVSTQERCARVVPADWRTQRIDPAIAVAFPN